MANVFGDPPKNDPPKPSPGGTTGSTTGTTSGSSTPPPKHNCPKGFIWSDQYKVCVEKPPKVAPPKCPEGYVWDAKKKLCITPDTYSKQNCPPGFLWSVEFNTCVEAPEVKERKCPDGYYWDSVEKLCRAGRKPLPEGMIGPQWGARSARAAATSKMMAGEGSGTLETEQTTTSGGTSGGTTTSGGRPEEPNPNQPLIDAAVQLYFNLWGQVPPAGYIEGLVRSGMNLYEIEANERSKESFQYTPVGLKAKADMEATVARTLGMF